MFQSFPIQMFLRKFLWVLEFKCRNEFRVCMKWEKESFHMCIRTDLKANHVLILIHPCEKCKTVKLEFLTTSLGLRL